LAGRHDIDPRGLDAYARRGERTGGRVIEQRVRVVLSEAQWNSVKQAYGWTDEQAAAYFIKADTIDQAHAEADRWERARAWFLQRLSDRARKPRPSTFRSEPMEA
jgi:hypothetical protein